MERTKKGEEPLSTQMKENAKKPIVEKKEYDGNFGTVISTGSTLLDLAISGGRIRGGGLPGGILVEVFGPSGSGKTVLLSEIAGAVQRQSGDIMFADPEARLNRQFAAIFGLELRPEDYSRPDTVNGMFKVISEWEPTSFRHKKINGIFADSLAALSTEMEMESADKMGMKRAKDFSEQFRKICRVLADKNFLMVCSNQIRENPDAGPYGQRWKTPGGQAMSFYASLRLRHTNPDKIWVKKTVEGKEVKRVIGIEVTIDIFKSSIWKPYHTAPLYILFDYGIDDIRANLQYIKDFTKNKAYTLGETTLSTEMLEAIKIVESDPNLVIQLRNQVIDLWEEIESKFTQERVPKR